MACAALAWSGTALASDTGLVDEYTEQVPTASGPKGTNNGGGGGGGPTTPTPLPSTVQTQIQQQGGSDKNLLNSVATSPRYGAPQTHQLDKGQSLGSNSPGAVSAAVTAVTDGSGARLLVLFIALLVTAALMLGAVAARHSRRART
jgi:hypothetical protein